MTYQLDTFIHSTYSSIFNLKIIIKYVISFLCSKFILTYSILILIIPFLISYYISSRSNCMEMTLTKTNSLVSFNHNYHVLIEYRNCNFNIHLEWSYQNLYCFYFLLLIQLCI